MRASEALTYEPAACWRRLQAAKSEFSLEDLDELMKERHQQFLEELMGYERQCFLNVCPYERSEQRVDQANGFYRRHLTTRLGSLELKVPRTRSGHFRTQVVVRYQRRQPIINEALKQVFLLGVSTRQAGRALATLVEDAVSAAPPHFSSALYTCQREHGRFRNGNPTPHSLPRALHTSYLNAALFDESSERGEHSRWRA